jgi:hypothetical protein
MGNCSGTFSWQWCHTKFLQLAYLPVSEMEALASLCMCIS